MLEASTALIAIVHGALCVASQRAICKPLKGTVLKTVFSFAEVAKLCLSTQLTYLDTYCTLMDTLTSCIILGVHDTALRKDLPHTHLPTPLCLLCLPQKLMHCSSAVG